MGEIDTIKWLSMSNEEIIKLINNELIEMNIHKLVKMLCVALNTNHKEYTSRKNKK